VSAEGGEEAPHTEEGEQQQPAQELHKEEQSDQPEEAAHGEGTSPSEHADTQQEEAGDTIPAGKAE